jgi:sugar porter (SP) family MFS transporter
MVGHFLSFVLIFLQIGYDSAFIGTTLALPSFVAEFGLSEKRMSTAEIALTKANIVSVYQAGAFFGALGAYITSFYLGRRMTLLIWTAIFMVGAGMMLGANGERGLGLIIGGRVLAGLGVGACSNMVPIYISELSPPAVRGRLVGIYELGWQIGGLVGFWINYGLQETMAPSTRQWHIPFAVQLIPAGCLLLGTLWLKESPRWQFANGKRDQAIKDLCWIRNLDATDPYIQEEVAAIDAEIEHNRVVVGAGFWAPFKAIKQRNVQWRLFLGAMLFAFQNGAGINAINYYSPTVFKSIGITGTSTGFLTTGIFGVVKTICTIIWLLWLIDRLGRTKLLMIGALGGSFCMWVIGAYIKLSNVGANASNPNPKLSSGGIAAVFFFYLWTVFYTPSWNGTPWVINSEMFSQQTRSLGQTGAASSNWLFTFLISRFTPQMFLKMGYGVYFFFACLMLLSVPFVYFLLPETKGIPLERMDELFEIKPTAKAHGVMLERLQEIEAVREGGYFEEKAKDAERRESV